MPAAEMPQQRVEPTAQQLSSETELIALILHSGIEGHSVLGLAPSSLPKPLDAGLASCQPMDFQRFERNWPG